jgi:hypothetical protein
MEPGAARTWAADAGTIARLGSQRRAEAMAIAQQCPATEWSSLEVRELGPCFT